MSEMERLVCHKDMLTAQTKPIAQTMQSSVRASRISDSFMISESYIIYHK